MTMNKKAKGFFALDVDQFFQIEKAGLGIEEAAAYLALMKSTDKSNIVSRGGINSITDYTGLTKSEAKRAIANLERADLIEKLAVERVRAKTLPRFKLPISETRTRLSPQEAKVMAQIETGEQPVTKSDVNAAQRAGQKGWIEKLSNGWATVSGEQRIAYIPNLFVHTKGQTSHLGRLMQIGELGPVMLAVELYHKQDLMNERGVPARGLRKYFELEESLMAGVSPSGYRFHALRPGRSCIEQGESESFETEYEPRFFRRGNVDFWSNLQALEKAHVVEWTVYSANGKPKNDSDFKRPQRPLGVIRNEKQVQNTPEAAAAFFSYHLLMEQLQMTGRIELPPPDQMITAWREYPYMIAVENAHVTHVEGIGILRMVHRASTENTAQWFRDLHKERQDALFFLETVRKQAFPDIVPLQYDSLLEAENDLAISN